MRKAVALALLLCIAFSFTSQAAVTRSQEEWATLADDYLGFEEIDALIHEYNPAVKKNNYELSDFNRHYGKTNDSMKDAYLELADELRSTIDYGNPSDPMYGVTAGLAISNDVQASQYEMLADSSTDDYETYRLSYEQAEMAIAQSAKAAMIDYYVNSIALQEAQLNAQLQGNALNIKNLQLSLGMTTQAEVLTAQENQLSAQQTLTAATNQLPLLKKKLQVLCGWKYESDPVLGVLPAVDMNRINAINPATDLQTAISNNYTLRINQRKLSNANSTSTSKTLTATIDSNKQNISTSIYTAYNGIIAARDGYNYAVSNSALQNANLAAIRARYAKGGVSAFELKSQETQTAIAALEVSKAQFMLLSAVTNYDYAVSGLAGA